MKLVLGLTALFLMFALIGFSAGAHTLPVVVRQPGQLAVKTTALVDRAEFKGKCQREAKGSDLLGWGKQATKLSKMKWVLERLGPLAQKSALVATQAYGVL